MGINFAETMKHSYLKLISLSLFMVLLSILWINQAAAQWVWRDANGKTVFSDQAPPKNIPDKAIIKSPNGTQSSQEVRAQNATGNTPDNNQSTAAPKTIADKELDFQKRQKDAADAAKKQEAEAKKAQEKQAYCTSLRSNLAAIQNGGRLVKTNEKGERTYLDDQQRETEGKNLRKQLDESCK